MKTRYLFNLLGLQIFHSNSDDERHKTCKGSMTTKDFLAEILIIGVEILVGCKVIRFRCRGCYGTNR
jgi:hypothetical protein